MTYKILIRVDAHLDIGLAHAVRVRGLLEAMDVSTEVFVWGRGDNLADVLPFASIFETTDDLLWGMEQVLEQVSPNMILVDHPHLSADQWARLYQAAPCSVVAIDDEGGPVQADLVINGTVLPAYHHYPALASASRALCGGRYALVNDVFHKTPWHGENAGRGVCVVVGGGVRAADWVWALAASDGPLAALGGGDVVVGQSYAAFDALKERAASIGVTVHRGLKQADLCRILAAAPCALITGGMIVYEALAMGVPAVVYPQEKNLPPEADWFARHGAIVNLGFDGGMDMALVQARVHGLLSDAQARRTLSRHARDIIDGKGMARAAQAVGEVLTKSGTQ